MHELHKGASGQSPCFAIILSFDSISLQFLLYLISNSAGVSHQNADVKSRFVSDAVQTMLYSELPSIMHLLEVKYYDDCKYLCCFLESCIHEVIGVLCFWHVLNIDIELVFSGLASLMRCDDCYSWLICVFWHVRVQLPPYRFSLLLNSWLVVEKFI